MAKKKKKTLKSNKNIKKAKPRIANKSTTVQLKESPKKTTNATKKPSTKKSTSTKESTTKQTVAQKKSVSTVNKGKIENKEVKKATKKSQGTKKIQSNSVSAQKKKVENKAADEKKVKAQTVKKKAGPAGKQKQPTAKKKVENQQKNLEENKNAEIKKKKASSSLANEKKKTSTPNKNVQKKPYKRKFIFLDAENKEELREEEIVEEEQKETSLEEISEKKWNFKKKLGVIFSKIKNRLKKNKKVAINAKESKEDKKQFAIKKRFSTALAKIKKIVGQRKDKKKSKKQKLKKEKSKAVKKTIQIKQVEPTPNKKKFSFHLKHKTFILIVLFCVMLFLLTLFPYGITNYRSEASGKILDVPKYLNLTEECCNFSAKFSSFRSAGILEQEMEEILSGYEVLDCDGIKYYYNSKEDYTVTEYQVIKGFPFSRVSITYGKGNSCDIDTTFKRIELLADDFSLEDAKKDGNYVIDGDAVYNTSAYSEFLENVKNKKTSTLRIVTTTEDRDVIIIDLEYLSDGKYKVTYDGTRDRHSSNHNSMEAYKYEHLGVFHNRLYAYNGNNAIEDTSRTETSYYLFSLVSKK